MSYITQTDYEIYTKESLKIEKSEFVYLASRASDVIDSLTRYKIHVLGFEKLNAFQAAQVKKAVCAEIQFLEQRGGAAALGDEVSGSVTIGKFSYSTGGNQSKTQNALPIAPLVKGFLMPTGLLYSGIQ